MLKLNYLRNLRGLTQSQVAEKLGVTQVTYCHYEASKVKISLNSAIKLAKIFNCSLSELVSEDVSTRYKDLTNEINKLSAENKKLRAEIKTLNHKFDVIVRFVSTIRERKYEKWILRGLSYEND